MNEAIDGLISKTGLSNKDLAERLDVTERTIYRYANLQSTPNKLLYNEIKKLADLANNSTVGIGEHKFRFIDLFAGIGGFRKAFDSIGGQCVFTSEWDKQCRTTYMTNYDCNHPLVGDIRDFTESPDKLNQIPEHDVLVGGFPCQPFSLAGVSKKKSLGRGHGFKDKTQGTLFFDVAKIIQHHRPKAFLLENVKNLKSHDKGNTFGVIKDTLENELEYDVHTRIIDGRNFVPQHRERIFIVGFDKKNGFDFNDFVKPDFNPVMEVVLHTKTEEDEPPYFIDSRVNEKYTLTTRMWEYLQEYKKKHQAKGNGFGFGLVGKDDVSRTLSARYYKDGSEILIKQRGTRPRRLTPRECARLMGFDSTSESNFIIPVSDTQSYKQFGNSVIVPVATAVTHLMLPFILEAVETPSNQTNIFEVA